MNGLDFIKIVKIQDIGYKLTLENGSIYSYVSKVDGNIEYELIKQWLAEGNIPEPEFTEEELAKQKQDKDILEKQLARKALMLEGKDYNGHQISFTKDDGDGLVQVKSAFELGLAETTIHFDCGTNFFIKAEDFSVFALWFVKERNKFFMEESEI